MGDTDDVCWEHLGHGSRGGHVRVRLDDKSRIMIHRLAYEAYHAEPIPENMQVNHHCDNPKCFNPHHLYLGTQKDNMSDKIQRGRANSPRKLDDDDIKLIISSSKTNTELSKVLGVSRTRIYQIRKDHLYQ